MLLNGVGAQEHLTGINQQQYLMYGTLNPQMWGKFVFDDGTRQKLGLKVKEFSRLLA